MALTLTFQVPCPQLYWRQQRLNDETTQDTDVRPIHLIVEQQYFSGTLMRFRYRPLAIIRRALLWGSIFAIFWVGLFAIRGPKPDAPPILNVGLVTFSFAAFFSLLRELEWRCLKISDKYLCLYFSGGRVYWKPRQEINHIDVFSHSESKIALRINWKENDTNAWVVSGTIVGKTYNDLIDVFANKNKLVEEVRS